MKQIENIKQCLEEKPLIKVKGLYLSKNIKTNEEEVIVDINGLKGRIKINELDLQEDNTKRINDYIGKRFFVTITSIEGKKIYCSRKEAQNKIIKKELSVGDEFEGIITNILDYGVYLVIYDRMVSCFVKNEDLAEKGISISDVYKIGQSISVIITNCADDKISVEPKEKYRVNRSLYLSNIEEGEVIPGFVSNSNVDRTFVRIAPGIDVLCSAESGLYSNDKVDIEITKVDLEKKALRGKIIDINKVNKYIENLEEGSIVKGVVKKINENSYYIRIGTCAYVECDLQEDCNISVGKTVNVKIEQVNIETRKIMGTYFDNNKLNEVLKQLSKGEIVEGTIKYKTDISYIVNTTFGISILCRNNDNSLNLDDSVSVDITSVNTEDVTIKGIIIDMDKKKSYLSDRGVGEELNGTVIKIKDDICSVKIFVGVDMVCKLPENFNIKKDDQVRVRITEISQNIGVVYGKVTDKLEKDKKELILNTLEDLNDYTRPFVLYGWDKPIFSNVNRKINTSAIYEMIHSDRINDRDLSIIRFLMDCRFATGNQIYRYLGIKTTKSNLINRIKKLVERRILNSFRIKEGNLIAYCIDIGGKLILSRENNKKAIDWTHERVNKSWNVIGKALISTEMFVRAKENYENSQIEFNASPSISKDIDIKKQKQVVFSMKIETQEHKECILGEVYRKDDKENAFDKRIGNLQEYLVDGLWEVEFKEYGIPKIVIIVENEDMISWVNDKLDTSYPNVVKNLVVTTDTRLDEDVL